MSEEDLGATDARLDQDVFTLTPVGRREARRRNVDDEDEQWPLKAGERHVSEYTTGRTLTRARSGPRDEVVEKTEEATLEVFDQ